MKRFTFKTFTVLVTFLVTSTSIYSQIDYDSLANVYIDRYDTIGYAFFNDEPALEPGDPIDMYKSFTGDEFHDLVLVKEWSDEITDYRHYKYQEYYKGLKVEAAEYIEHALDDKLEYANGKIAYFEEEVSEKEDISEEEALESLLYYLNEYELEYTWEDSLWEASIKLETGDSTATYFPEGELMWALDSYHDLQWLIPSTRYTLAYRFEITTLSPQFQKAFYVDASTGTVFREEQLVCSDGPANIINHGTQIIDDAWSGPNSAYILKTNDDGRNVHTKLSPSGFPFFLTGETQDADGNWGSSYQETTTAHWLISKAWDFHDDAYNYQGYNDNGNKVKVFVDLLDDQVEGAFYRKSDNIIYFGYFNPIFNQYYSAISDVAGHEYRHGIDDKTASLAYESESGALNESFSDIFGVLTEAYINGSVDWDLGEDLVIFRSMSNPKVYNQPDTYLGDNWYNTNGCSPDASNDYCGVHTNSGVQNYWFYLLANGGSGTNDNGYYYNIDGIGEEKAGMIAHLNQITQMTSGSHYGNAWIGSIVVAEILYGACSTEHLQTIMAWKAVGLPLYVDCNILGESETKEISFSVYPNPTSENFRLESAAGVEKTMKLYTIDGKLLKDYGKNSDAVTQISINDLSSGIYLFMVKAENETKTFKIVKK